MTAGNPIPPTGGKGFWDRLLRFLAAVVTLVESLSGPGNGARKKDQALALVLVWYRDSGIRIPYLPGPVERWVVRTMASDLIDSLVELLKAPALEAHT